MNNLLTIFGKWALLTALYILPLSSIAESFPERLFQTEHDQPRLQKLYKWDNRIVAQAGDFFFEINPEQATAMPIHFVGGRSMISLTTAFGKPFALGGSGEYYRVLFHRSGKSDWDMIRVPGTSKSKEDRYSIIIGDENTLVLLGENSFKIFDGTNWVSQAYKNEFRPNNSDACVLWNGNLYYGYDRGEWGGGLQKLSLSTGEWTSVDHEMPFKNVSDLTITPVGNLKVTCGLAHLRLQYGRIAEISSEGIVNEWYISNYGESDGRWEYDIADFQSLRYNTAGEQVLFAPTLGFLVYCNEIWVRLTPEWNSRFHVSSFLILDENEYVLGTSSSGVAIINFEDKTEKIIRLATSFYKWEEK